MAMAQEAPGESKASPDVETIVVAGRLSQCALPTRRFHLIFKSDCELERFPARGGDYLVSLDLTELAGDVTIPSNCFYRPGIWPGIRPRPSHAINAQSMICRNLRSVLWPPGLLRVGNGGFSFSGLTELDFRGTKLVSIEAGAFSNCTQLHELYVPSTLEIIGRGSFRVSNLRCLDLSKCRRLQEVGDWAFERSSRLRFGVLPAHEISMNVCAFGGCSDLRELDIVSARGRMDEAHALSLGFLTLRAAMLPPRQTALCRGAVSAQVFSGTVGVGRLLARPIGPLR
jgi:hypothetical protein